MRTRSELWSRDCLGAGGLFFPFKNFFRTNDPRIDLLLKNMKCPPSISALPQNSVPIHNLIQIRKYVNVLELGSGSPTLAAADTLTRNSQDLHRFFTRPKLRRENPFAATSIVVWRVLSFLGQRTEVLESDFQYEL